MSAHPRFRLLLAPLALAVLGAAAIAVAVAARPARAGTASTATVRLGKSSLGRMLVDGRGRTLYLFEKDRGGRSSCTGACARFWPPLLTTTKPRAGTGVRAGLLGTTRRPDGKLQVTYRRHPLYAFALDKRAGQTKGEGTTNFGAEWYVVSAAGTKIEPDDESSTSAGGSGGGYGYGYGAAG
jgi:predicted lipoprotein with Yx(FWY)xxD motif